MTLNTIVSNIRAELGVPSTDTVRLPEASIISRVNKRGRWMVGKHDLPCALVELADVTMTGGQWTYALPSDFLRPFSIRIQTAGEDPAPLISMDPRLAEDEYPDPTDASLWGTPVRWSRFGSTLWVLPPNETAGTLLKIRYYARFADLTMSAPYNTNALVEACGDALEALACGDCARFLFEESRAIPYWDEGKELLDDYLRDSATQYQMTRRPIAEEV